MADPFKIDYSIPKKASTNYLDLDTSAYDAGLAAESFKPVSLDLSFPEYKANVSANYGQFGEPLGLEKLSADSSSSYTSSEPESAPESIKAASIYGADGMDQYGFDRSGADANGLNVDGKSASNDGLSGYGDIMQGTAQLGGLAMALLGMNRKRQQMRIQTEDMQLKLANNRAKSAISKQAQNSFGAAMVPAKTVNT